MPCFVTGSFIRALFCPGKKEVSARLSISSFYNSAFVTYSRPLPLCIEGGLGKGEEQSWTADVTFSPLCSCEKAVALW